MRLGTLLLLSVLLVGCDVQQRGLAPGAAPQAATKPATLAPGEKPQTPFVVTEPAAPPKKLGQLDLESLDSDDLAALARRRATQSDYAQASVLQHCYLVKSQEGYYDCACYFARVGKANEAFYCLVKGGLEEGFDLDHAKTDEDLLSLHNDPRWRQLLPYLEQCEQYWKQSGKSRTTLVLPAGYSKAKGGELWAITWMHGMGSKPEGLVDPKAEDSLSQALATELNIAFIGVSGTKPRGRNSFVWAENPDADFARVKAALTEVSDRVNIRPAGVIAFGFSQGALAGAEIAARNPEVFGGAIALSSGGLREFQLDTLTAPSPLLKKRGFVFGCGAKEHPGNVMLTRDGAAFTKRFGATTSLELFPGQAAHSFPADFDKKFRGWVKAIQKAQLN